MYELLFWKYCDGVYLNHHEVYEQLVDSIEVDGLEKIPSTIILNRITNLFSSWEKVDDNSWKNSSGNGAFQIINTNYFVKIDCYGTDGKTMDLLVSILNEFDCPLYDLQIPARYDEYFE